MRLVWLIVLMLSAPSALAREWEAVAATGGAYNFSSPLTLEQGNQRWDLTADYDTRPFDAPLYYALRAGHFSLTDGWEGMLIHHKLYLRNPPTGVRSLSMTHGFNIVTANRAWEYGGYTYRLGLGPVITSLQTEVNGVMYDDRYALSGAALLFGVGKRFYQGRHWFLAGDLIGSYAKASVDVDGAPALKADITNLAVHAQLGIGVRF